MRQLLTVMLDLLFPPSQAALLVRNTDLAETLTEYHPKHFLHTTYLSEYRTPIIQASITQNKFHHDTKAAQHLGGILQSWHATQSTGLLYLPIPLSPQRERVRGYNQVTQILRAAKLQAAVNTSVLQRVVHTAAQSSLSRADRLTNPRNAFSVNTRELATIQNNHIVIIDDVVTTGATLLAAKRALLPHLPTQTKLTLLALAH